LLSWLLALITLLAVILATPTMGRYLYEVFDGQPQPSWDRWLNPLEQSLLRWIGDKGKNTDTVMGYVVPLLISNALFMAVALLLLLHQPAWLNPEALPGLRWDLALHTAISFVTSADQQHLIPEQSLGNLAQLGAIQFLMFVSAATGLSVGFAFIRGMTGKSIGNFYRDLIRALTRVLIPGSLLLAFVYVICGVPMTLAPPLEISTLEGNRQLLSRGPIALFEAIKQLGINGGGFVNANSSHPYENPNLLSNLISTWAMIILPAATIDSFGRFAANRRQSNLLLIMVFGLLAVTSVLAMSAEQGGNPTLSTWLSGSNLEGKELRLGAQLSGFWSMISTSTMTGSLNGLLDSSMPLTILLAMFNLFLQVLLGGLGTGIANLVVFLVLTVFLTGLMVGRTPEFLGRKVERSEVIWASVVLLIHPIFVLIPTAMALISEPVRNTVSINGPHGVSQVVYEFASAAANNGSGLEGLADNSLWWNLATSVSLLGGRFLPIIAILLLADGFRRKPAVEPNPGSLHTDTVLFTSVAAVVVVILGALTFFPVMALGPIAEALSLGS
jgi:potassium-transporting ATPase potassium-binding subunit